MKRFSALLSVLICLGLLSSQQLAAQESAIRKALAQRLPKELTIDSVEKSAMPGLYEVRIGGTDLVYTDESGKFLIIGSLQDLKTGRNFTQEKADGLAMTEVFKPNNLKNALKLVKGNGKREMVVFEDANCGYCKKIRAEMEQLKDVTIYTYLIPILGDDSATKMNAIWCAKDRNATYDAWMMRAQQPPAADERCKAPIEANAALARALKVNGTPALFFKNGKRVPGYIEAAAMSEHLASAAKP